MKKLPIIDEHVVQNVSCFAAQECYGIPCEKRSCRYWIDSPEHVNCCHIAAKRPMTLHNVGMIFGLTRMRICQIEKIAKRRVIEMLLQHFGKKETQREGIEDGQC